MRRRLAFLLLALYLCAATEGYQLLKMPLLAIHFVQHCNEDPNITLAAFLKMHYSDDWVLDDDWQQDMQLPFKSCSHPEVSVAASMRTEPLVLQIPEWRYFLNAFTPHLPSMYRMVKVTEIFQPPRLPLAA